MGKLLGSSLSPLKSRSKQQPRHAHSSISREKRQLESKLNGSEMLAFNRETFKVPETI